MKSGDLVKIRHATKIGLTTKFLPKFLGPYKVVAVCNNGNDVIVDLVKKIDIVNITNVEPFYDQKQLARRKLQAREYITTRNDENNDNDDEGEKNDDHGQGNETPADERSNREENNGISESVGKVHERASSLGPDDLLGRKKDF